MPRPTAAPSAGHRPREYGRRLTRHGRTIIAASILALTLSGCTPGTTSPGSTATHGPSGSPGASGPTNASAPAPTYQAGGTAEQNLPAFTATVETVWGSSDKAQGRAYVDALVAVGFDKAAMQVTSDTSTVGNAAESIQFSVRMGDQCLVGQVGPATGDPVTTVLPVLGGGVCLLGKTRPINW
ncbi:DUF6993 domain-containing protein [Microbacterium sp. ASV49]|uniref:DUF6993 domain-containing protein n=1 Tax=Microbacterium candidum TaxID=3041922 RepID=A0ABT7MYM2_9MICO|nr:hypothetical protein [Microbacterium sp. ASV49]MDL9979555.1 hypothetical protein [Microbacterium sp. ASV49]